MENERSICMMHKSKLYQHDTEMLERQKHVFIVMDIEKVMILYI